MTDTAPAAPAAPATPNAPPMIETVDPKYLAGLAGKIKKAERDLSADGALAKVTAKTRATWQVYGRALADARAVLSSPNKFNTFLKDNGLEGFASRNARTDAMWLADLDPDFVSDVVPATLHSPVLIRSWYRKTLDAVVAGTKGKTDDAQATEALSSEHKAFFDAVDASDWDAAVTRWKNSSEPVKFRDMPIGDAVAAVLKKIGSYTAPGKLADAVRDAMVNHDWTPAPAPETPAPAATEPAPEPVDETPVDETTAPETTEPEPVDETPEPGDGPVMDEAIEEAIVSIPEPAASPAPAERRRRRN